MADPALEPVVGAATSDGPVDGVGRGKKRRKGGREFDWSKASFEHFVLKVAYVGTAYHGLAWQEPECCPTVEAQLFAALTKTCLIRDRQSCNYSRCGRTDKGVHAAGNYVALQVRVRPAKDGAGSCAATDDYDYVSMLNGVLPADVRILAATRAPAGFDARFSCKFRYYQYYFPFNGEDFQRMREAAQHFVGEHDFRNFCKMDVENVTNFRRSVLSVSVEPRPCQVGEFAVTGVAFLWHQVRCMTAVLLLVGQGLEEPSIVTELLNIKRRPCKPLYDQADETGLVLRDCGFEGIPFAPGWPPPAAGTMDGAASVIIDSWDAHNVAPSSAAEGLCRMRAQARRMAAVHECLASVAATAANASTKDTGRSKRAHTPLLQRAVCPSLEEKQLKLHAKQVRKGVEVAEDLADE